MQALITQLSLAFLPPAGVEAVGQAISQCRQGLGYCR